MNKILAISPESIEEYSDWLKIYSRLGQSHGVFLADYPKKWTKKFGAKLDSIEFDRWQGWDNKKIQEFFINLKNQNGFLSLESPYSSSTWESNYLDLKTERKKRCIAIGTRKNPEGIQDFESFDVDELVVEDTIEKAFKPGELVDLLKDYFLSTGKIAIVDRYGYLQKKDGNISEFAKFLQEILLLKSDRLGQIIVYVKHDNDYDFLKSNEVLEKTLFECFHDLKTPCWGIKYVSCVEAGGEMDLHNRRIITNNALFQFSDSLPGNNKSQSITRIQSKTSREKAISLWVDESVKIERICESTYINLAPR